MGGNHCRKVVKMILVIGGACQGKLKLVFSWLEQNIDRSGYADGADDPWQEFKERNVVYGVQEYIKRGMEEQINLGDWVTQLIAADPEYVIMDEVGYGVVPIRKEVRQYREQAGQIGQLLAREAQAVYRVVCGIPVKIK